MSATRADVFSDLTDEQLVGLVRESPSGDLRAFNELVRRHERRVQANCRYLTGSAADAEDLTQEVLVKAYFGLNGFQERAQFSTWLYRVKANHCINFNLRRQRTRHMSVEPSPSAPPRQVRVEPVGVRRLVALETRERIQLVLDAMSETLRVPLLLRDGDHLSYEEIAELLEISLSAVKMRINRGRADFRARYLAIEADVQADDVAADGTDVHEPGNG